MIETQPVLSPPNKPPLVATDQEFEFPDDIKELGDSIAALSPNQAKQLDQYLKSIT